jgi:hypothetical protein
MKLPLFLYGKYADVKRNCRIKIKAIDLASFDFFNSEPVFELDDKGGLVLMQPPNPLMNTMEMTHIYLLHFMIRERLQKGEIESSLETLIFSESLKKKWSLLALLATANVLWVYKENRYAPFLKAVKENIDLFNSEPGFSNGSSHGAYLSAIPNNLYYVLANAGIKPELFSDHSKENLLKRIDEALTNIG